MRVHEPAAVGNRVPATVSRPTHSLVAGASPEVPEDEVRHRHQAGDPDGEYGCSIAVSRFSGRGVPGQESEDEQHEKDEESGEDEREGEAPSPYDIVAREHGDHDGVTAARAVERRFRRPLDGSFDADDVSVEVRRGGVTDRPHRRVVQQDDTSALETHGLPCYASFGPPGGADRAGGRPCGPAVRAAHVPRPRRPRDRVPSRVAAPPDVGRGCSGWPPRRSPSGIRHRGRRPARRRRRPGGAWEVHDV